MAVRKCAEWLRRRQDDEHGAELVEFALVAVLLTMLVYGIVFFGVMFTAKSTITQAASDGARAGIVASTAPEQAAVTQAQNDLGFLGVNNIACSSNSSTYWCMGPCPSGISACTSSCSTSCTPACVSGVCPVSSVALMIVANEATPCSGSDSNTCLTTTVTYYDSTHPLFPQAPGFNLFSPNTLNSSSSLDITTTI